MTTAVTEALSAKFYTLQGFFPLLFRHPPKAIIFNYSVPRPRIRPFLVDKQGLTKRKKNLKPQNPFKLKESIIILLETAKIEFKTSRQQKRPSSKFKKILLFLSLSLSLFGYSNRIRKVGKHKKMNNGGKSKRAHPKYIPYISAFKGKVSSPEET